MLLLILSFFVLDFLFFTLFNGWFLYSLLGYFITLLFQEKTKKYIFINQVIAIILILLQDNFMNNRLGLGLLYLVPIILLAMFLKKILNSEAIQFACLILLTFAIATDCFVIKSLLLGQKIALYSTLFKIFINILVEIFILWGMLGNRSSITYGK